MLDDKTPHEVWISKKTFLTHLMLFSHDAYVYVPKEKITNLDRKYERCIFSVYKEFENLQDLELKRK